MQSTQLGLDLGDHMGGIGLVTYLAQRPLVRCVGHDHGFDICGVQNNRLTSHQGIAAASKRVRTLENSLDAIYADDSRSDSTTDRYPHLSCRNFRLVGIEQTDMARCGFIC